MSHRRKIATVIGTACTASLVAGLAAFAPTIFGWLVLAVVILCVLAFMLWSAWDAGYGEGWLDHSEGRIR